MVAGALQSDLCLFAQPFFPAATVDAGTPGVVPQRARPRRRASFAPALLSARTASTKLMVENPPPSGTSPRHRSASLQPTYVRPPASVRLDVNRSAFCFRFGFYFWPGRKPAYSTTGHASREPLTERLISHWQSSAAPSASATRFHIGRNHRASRPEGPQTGDVHHPGRHHRADTPEGQQRPSHRGHQCR